MEKRPKAIKKLLRPRSSHSTSVTQSIETNATPSVTQDPGKPPIFDSFRLARSVSDMDENSDFPVDSSNRTESLGSPGRENVYETDGIPAYPLPNMRHSASTPMPHAVNFHRSTSIEKKEKSKRKKKRSTRSMFISGIISSVMSNDPNITVLSFAGMALSRNKMKKLVHALKHNDVIHTIDLSNRGLAYPESDLSLLVNALYTNTSIRALKLQNTNLTQKCLKLLEDLVRNNANITLIDVWEDSFAKKEETLEILQKMHLLVQSNRLYYSFRMGYSSRLCLCDRGLSNIESFYFENPINLRQFDVSRNRLTTFPPEIGTARLMTDLKADENFISHLPPEIKFLTKLKRINISHNSLTMLPEEIGELHQLVDLDVSYNMLHSLPSSIGRLLSLEKLNLQHNRLSALPATIRLMKNLKIIDVSDNKITTIPADLGTIISLQILRCHNNPIKGIPAEMIYRGGADIISFLRAQSSGSTDVSRMKLMIVGCENVGKSTLFSRFLKQGKSSSRKRRLSPSVNTATDGIEVQDLVFKSETGIPIEVSAWDFAGQKVYYATHHFFLSHRSIYLLCFDLRRYHDSESKLEFWLQSIKARAGDAPTILVGTHSDHKMCTEAYLEEVVEYLQRKVSTRFPMVVAFRIISGVTGKGFDRLFSLITTTINSLPYIPETIPNAFLQCEKEIIAMRDVMTLPVISMAEFAIKAKSCGVSEESLPTLIRFLHDLGIIAHFPSVDNNLVILCPQWIADAFATIVSANQNFVKKGILKEKDLGQIWRPPEYSTTVYDFLLLLLEKFQVIHRIPNGGKIFVPSLLPEEGPSIPLAELWRKKNAGVPEVGRVFHFSFMPSGFFSKIMVRLLSSSSSLAASSISSLSSSSSSSLNMSASLNSGIMSSDDHIPVISPSLSSSSSNGSDLFSPKTSFRIGEYWKNGITLQSNQDSVLMVLKDNFWIWLTTRGPTAHKTSSSIMDSIESLARDWLQVTVDIYVPCVHCVEQLSDNPSLFPLSTCEQAVADGKGYLMCKGVERVPLVLLAPDVTMEDFRGERINMNEITIEKQIGVGGFARVYRGVWRGTTVAVKELFIENGKLDKLRFLKVFKEFRKEAAIMSYLNHENILKLKGLVINPFCMVLEYMSLGSLYDYLHDSNRIVNWKFRIAMAYDIANGMMFLHKHNIIHRDLKTPNILLSPEVGEDDKVDIVAKVSDFGLAAKSVLWPLLSHRAVQNPVWLAPEIMRKEEYSFKADVYSYGIILWELLTRRDVFEEINFLWEIEDAVMGGIRPAIPDDCPAPYRKLMVECWDPNPDNRPNFETIIQIIDEMEIATELLTQQTPVPERYSANADRNKRTNVCFKRSRSTPALSNIGTAEERRNNAKTKDQGGKKIALDRQAWVCGLSPANETSNVTAAVRSSLKIYQTCARNNDEKYRSHLSGLDLLTVSMWQSRKNTGKPNERNKKLSTTAVDTTARGSLNDITRMRKPGIVIGDDLDRRRQNFAQNKLRRSQSEILKYQAREIAKKNEEMRKNRHSRHESMDGAVNNPFVAPQEDANARKKNSKIIKVVDLIDNKGLVTRQNVNNTINLRKLMHNRKSSREMFKSESKSTLVSSDSPKPLPNSFSSATTVSSSSLASDSSLSSSSDNAKSFPLHSSGTIRRRAATSAIEQMQRFASSGSMNKSPSSSTREKTNKIPSVVTVEQIFENSPVKVETSTTQEKTEGHVESQEEIQEKEEEEVFAVALYDFEARNEMELSLSADEPTIIRVLAKHPNWWLGEANGRKGYFPANYTSIIDNTSGDEHCNSE